MKFNSPVNAFSSGAFSSDLRARFDLQQYSKALAKLENYLLLRTGGIVKREGTYIKHLVKHTDDIDNFFYYIPYSHKDYQIFVQVPIVNTGTPLYSSEWRWYIYKDENILEYTYHADSSNIVYWQVDRVERIQYAQVGDILTVIDTWGTTMPLVFKFIPSYVFNATKPYGDMKLMHYQDYVGIEYPTWITWDAPNADTLIEVTVNNKNGSNEGKRIPSGSRTTTCEVTSNVDLFTPQLQGRFIRININVNSVRREGIAKIVSIDNPRKMYVEEWVGFNGNGIASDDFAFSVVGGTSAVLGSSSWYTSVTSYQERLVFGGTYDKKDSVYCSMTGNPRIMMNLKLYQDNDTDYSGCRYYGKVEATDAFEVAIAGQEGLQVTFVQGANALIIGSNTRLFLARPTDNSGFTPTTTEVISEKGIACGSVMPVQTNEGTCFAGFDLKRLYIARYTDNTGELAVRDITLLNKDVISTKKNNYMYKYNDLENTNDKYMQGTVKNLCWNPHTSMLYVSNSFGSVAVLTMEEGANTLGWSFNYLRTHGAAGSTYLSNIHTGYTTQVFMHPMYQNVHCNMVGSYIDGVNAFANYRTWLSYGTNSATYKPLSDYRLCLDNAVQTDIAQDLNGDGVFWAKLPTIGDISYLHWMVNGAPYYSLIDEYTYDGVSYNPVGAHNNTFGEVEAIVEINGEWYAKVPKMGRYNIGFPYKALAELLPVTEKIQTGTSRGNPTRIDHITFIVDNTGDMTVFTNYNSDDIINQAGESGLITKDFKVPVPHGAEDEVKIGFYSALPMPNVVLGAVLEGVSYGD